MDLLWILAALFSFIVGTFITVMMLVYYPWMILMYVFFILWVVWRYNRRHPERIHNMRELEAADKLIVDRINAITEPGRQFAALRAERKAREQAMVTPQDLNSLDDWDDESDEF